LRYARERWRGPGKMLRCQPLLEPSPPQRLRGTFRLPASAPAGDYSVDLIGFKDQHAVHLASATLHIEHAGAVRIMRHLALDHGTTYGGAASLIAIVVGLLTGVLFRSRSNEGH
jgi:Putative transmembrane protein (Alph_Pro_TM)